MRPCSGCSLARPATAGATAPGQNGRIVYTWDEVHGQNEPAGNADIAVINPDGSGQTFLTGGPARDSLPRWSPDGAKIAFMSNRDGNTDVYVMDADGGNLTRLTTSPGVDGAPEWSPDGSKIGFAATRDGNTDVYVMDADGSNEVRLTDHPALDHSPTWSPDGGRLAFTHHDESVFPPYTDIYAVDIDASGLTLLTNLTSTDDAAPEWSPDGSRDRVHVQDPRPVPQLAAMDDESQMDPASSRSCPAPTRRITSKSGPPSATGFCSTTSRTRSTRTATGRTWSGSRMMLGNRGANDGLQTPGMSRGGSCSVPGIRTFPRAKRDSSWCDQMAATRSRSGRGEEPDWQPLPINAYPRPKGTFPLELSLVPAYQECTAANRTHGPPLAFPSCAPPQRAPGQLTVGTADSNQRPTKSVSIIRMRALPGIPSTTTDEADIALSGTVNDVRLASDLSDYTGTLEARMSLRITDKDNTPTRADRAPPPRRT